MKKIILIILLLTGCAISVEPLLKPAEELQLLDPNKKKLYYQYNDKVVIWITNQDCIDTRINKEYPYIAMAIRVDGDAMPGCYKNVNDDIKIQWIGGDFSVFPANVFLIPLLKSYENI